MNKAWIFNLVLFSDRGSNSTAATAHHAEMELQRNLWVAMWLCDSSFFLLVCAYEQGDLALFSMSQSSISLWVGEEGLIQSRK